MATTRQFGIITSITGLQAGIMVNSLDFNEQVETAEARNEKGAITDIAGYSNSKTVSIQGVMDTAKGSVATAGSVLTLDGKQWLIDSVARRESNTGFVELTISARTADNAEIYIVDASSSAPAPASGSGE